MTGPTRFTGASHGRSRLEGFNYREYPIHKFTNIKNPGPAFPLWPESSGEDQWRKECFRRRTFSDTFAVEYVQSGIFIFQQNNITMRVAPGEIFFVHLGQNNSMRCETAFATKRTVIMRGPLLLPALETLGLSRIDMVSPPEHAEIDRLFDEIDERVKNGTPENMRALSDACYALLLELAGQSAVLRHPEELQRAMEYIHAHLDDPPDLDDLIRCSGVSRATLHRQFRKHLGTSPVKYFLDRKLERAKMLLENHPHSIKEVAEMLNYASPQYFAAEFKKKYGVPPKNFKCRRIVSGND